VKKPIYEIYAIKEKIFHMVLDNYSVHKSNYIKIVAEILNINLIPLPTTYSSDLNPIEDVWRVIKKHVSNKFISTGKKIVNLYIGKIFTKQ
jgi:transposase